MLTRLYLKDFAVVSEADIVFGPGLSVVSGETGAGKSLMVDALLLLTGARADAGMVRHGTDRAELQAEFDLDDAPEALAWLREQELDDADADHGGACALRRVIRADGGSKAWINGRAATLAQLGDLGERLIQIHGQHEHQALLSRAHQLDLLDAFADAATARDAVRRLAADWLALTRRLHALADQGDVGERIDYLAGQAEELDREALAPADIDELISAHRRQSHAAQLIQGCDRALARLAGDEGFALGSGLRQVQGELARMSEHEPRLGEIASMVESAQIQLDEAAASLARVRDDLDADPDRLQALEDQLGRLHELARKHRVPLEQLSLRQEALHSELTALREAGQGAERMESERATLASAWRDAAAALSRARLDAAMRLGEAVSTLMADLGMAGGQFSIALEPGTGADPDPQGAERVEFLVAANPGAPPRALRKVASGGELSRISLAIEVAALDLDAVPTMVFDEVDSGIGGGVAETVGGKLRALGVRRQVMCVTHLPQVAAQGHRHFRVSKGVADGATHTSVAALAADERVEELSRMLGGLQITRETRAHARQMLARAQAS